MTITLSSWFNEPNVKFRISHIVYKFIRQSLIDDVMISHGLEKRDPNLFLELVTCTSIKTTELEVRGPEYDKRNKFITYGLWLPFERINNSSHYVKEFLDLYFDALVLVFRYYSIEESVIRKVQSKTLVEVVDNDFYVI